MHSNPSVVWPIKTAKAKKWKIQIKINFLEKLEKKKVKLLKKIDISDPSIKQG